MKAYIFDLDGTLLDSMGIWEQIDIDFLAKRDITVPHDYIEKIAAMSPTEVARYTIDRFGLPDSVEGLIAEWDNMAAYAYGHTIPMKPYAREYLHALRERGARLAIATSLSSALYEPALKNHCLASMFDVICSTNEVGCGKTNPDVFLLAARKLGVRPEDCCVFEDIPEAIQSAKQVGMTVYGVYDEASKQQWTYIQQIADGALYDFSAAPLPT